jgi:hypothetical protein
MNQIMSARDRVLDWAHMCYCPELVAIDAAKLAELSPPAGAMSPMKAELIGKPMGRSLTDAIQYLIVLNSLNYRFWSLDGGNFFRYEYAGAIGAMGMRKAFIAAWGEDATPATFRRALLGRTIEEVFGDIPDPESRREILMEVLDEPRLARAADTLVTQVFSSGKVTVESAALLASLFPFAYSDTYLKKAQLALAEVAGHCLEAGIPVQPTLTVFADYQVPRVLRALGVLKYSSELSDLIDNQKLLSKYGAEEEAIRAAAILAGEQIAERFGVDPSVVDNYLWTHRSLAGKAPFHLTETTEY